MSYYLLGFRLWLGWALSMKYPPSKYSAITSIHQVILVYVSDTDTCLDVSFRVSTITSHGHYSQLFLCLVAHNRCWAVTA